MSRGSSLGGEGQSSYFNTVTGTNDYERQSWRDSFNGGYAAGDFTGNVNASLAQERSDFQGATVSGSSTQPNFLQLAQSMGGPGHAAISNGPQSSVSTGPGNAVVVSAPRKPSGGSLTLAGGPLKQTIKETAVGGWAGFEVKPNPWFSNVEDWWEPRFGEPGEWLGGIVNIGADGVFNAGRAADHFLGTNTVAGQKRQTVKLDSQLESDGALSGIASAFERQFSTWDRQLHQIAGQGRPYVGGGF